MARCESGSPGAGAGVRGGRVAHPVRSASVGTLSYTDQHTVYNRLSGTTTSLPSVGQVIKRGQTLFRVDNNKPVTLLYGLTPA